MLRDVTRHVKELVSLVEKLLCEIGKLNIVRSVTQNQGQKI